MHYRGKALNAIIHARKRANTDCGRAACCGHGHKGCATLDVRVDLRRMTYDEVMRLGEDLLQVGMHMAQDWGSLMSRQHPQANGPVGHAHKE